MSQASWRTRGACVDKNLPNELFFPEPGQGRRKNTQPKDIHAAGKLFCRNFCAYRWGCLLDNLDEEHGVFGGTDPGQRREIRVRVRIKNQATLEAYVKRNFEK